jgi:hypothetical protein
MTLRGACRVNVLGAAFGAMVSGGAICLPARETNMPIGRIGLDFIVDTTGAGNQGASAIAELADGRFVVTWTSFDGGDGSGSCLRARVYAADGTPQLNDFIVNTTHTGSQDSSSVAALADGRFVVVWRSTDTLDGSGTCVRAILCDADGSPIGNDFIVETTTDGNQSLPAVTSLADGGFVVTWQSDDQSPSSIRAAIFDADGARIGSDFPVGNTDVNGLPAVVTLTGDRFIVAWATDEIAARLFDSESNALGSEFGVNTTTAGIQTAPSVAMLADGHFIVAWQSGAGVTFTPARIRVVCSTAMGPQSATISWSTRPA